VVARLRIAPCTHGISNEQPIRPAAAERVAHEIHRPRRVERRWRVQRHDLACRHAHFGPSHLVRAQCTVHAVDALVVPRMAQRAEAVEALPEAPAAMLLDDGLRGRDYRRIEARILPLEILQPLQLRDPHAPVLLLQRECRLRATEV